MSFDQARVREILKEYAPEKGNLMVVMHKIQKACGNYLPDEAMKEVSLATGIPLNKLYGFVSFYTMFSTQKRGRHIVRICKDGPCNFRGGMTSAQLLKRELGIEVGQTTDDGRFTLEETACLGTCTAAPAMMVDEEIYAHMTPETVGEILKKYK